jgi:hypothetical protein
MTAPESVVAVTGMAPMLLALRNQVRERAGRAFTRAPVFGLFAQRCLLLLAALLFRIAWTVLAHDLSRMTEPPFWKSRSASAVRTRLRHV